MAILGNGNGSDYPVSIDSAEQQVDGAGGTVVDANLLNDYGSAITAIETELGTAPSGSLADVATRLSTLIASAGGITSGTTANRPTAASGTYRLYWNTTLNQLEVIKDDATVTSVAGVTDHGSLTGLTDDDHTQYGLIAGSRNYTGDVVVEKSTPALQLKGTETDAKNCRWYESAGVIYLQEYSGAVWNTRLQIDLVTGTLTDTTGYLSLGGGVVVHTPASDPTGSSTEGALWYDSVTDEFLFRNASKPGPLYPVHQHLPVYESQGDTTPVLMKQFKLYFPSGSKTVQMSANMYANTSYIAYVTASFGTSLASASASTTSTTTTEIVGLPQFTYNASGWQTLSVSAGSNNSLGTSFIEYLTFFAR